MQTIRVLVADDDLALRHALRTKLARWGYEAVDCSDGTQAWKALQQEVPPALAILDWHMPGLDGITLCRQVRQTPALAGTYLILLTGSTRQEDVLAGLESGADDYVKKPFDWNELQARVRTGARIVGLQQALTARVAELQEALSNVRRLSGLVPICAYCKRIRDDGHYWQRIEEYIAERSDAEFSHGICPSCASTHFDAVG